MTVDQMIDIFRAAGFEVEYEELEELEEVRDDGMWKANCYYLRLACEGHAFINDKQYVTLCVEESAVELMGQTPGYILKHRDSYPPGVVSAALKVMSRINEIEGDRALSLE